MYLDHTVYDLDKIEWKTQNNDVPIKLQSLLKTI